MSEKLKNNHEEERVSSADNSVSEFPPFDPANATRLRNEALDAKFQPEEMKKPENIIDQLESLGANEKITSNPAFGRIVEDTIQRYGLMRAQRVRGNRDTDGKTITLECTGANTYDAWGHDRADYNISVRDDKIILMAACVDREMNKMNAKLFKNYQGGPNGHFIFSNGTTECIEDKNLSQIVEISQLQNSDGIYVSMQSGYEDQIRPRNDGKEQAYYFGTKQERVSTYDADGNEMWREDKLYDGVEHYNLPSAFFGDGRSQGKENLKTSWAALTGHSVTLRGINNDVKERMTYSRNDDGTIRVEGYRQGGQKLKMESVAMDTQYGTKNLVPANGEITKDDWEE